ncbi:unnamed protein product [Penicillium glandicola]
MKAVLESWVSKIRQFEGEDEIIVRNAFEFNGMGVPIQSVLVTGERVPAGEAGDALYHYKFLWIIEPMVSPTLGVTGSYPCTLRPTMSGLSRLRKAEIVYYNEDVQGMERAMHAEFAENSNIKFIREIIRPDWTIGSNEDLKTVRSIRGITGTGSGPSLVRLNIFYE